MTDTSLTGRRWRWPELSKEHGEGWLPALLSRRGLVGDAVGPYLSPSLTALEDPAAMADMPIALEILGRAVTRGERITVYGDYDVDGVSACTVLVDFLRRIGADVRYYIPDRRSEGYGLNEEAVRTLCAETRVLVTADCGITAHREVALAKSLGAQVIIIDHHRVPAELPPADACLNPLRADCAFAFKGLCAAGLAFMVCVALRRALRAAGHFAVRAEPDVRDLLDVVAVATVADMVPLQGINRVLVAAGQKRMASSRRLGLLALLDVAKVDRENVTSTALAFRVAPRINARGRLSHAGEAVELLLTEDPERARELAQALDQANLERRQVEKDTVVLARQSVEREHLTDDDALVVYDASWHPGVLGLVATRLVQSYHRPAIVIGEGGKGSGRSVPGLDLHAAIEAGREHLLRYGGHAAAAGVTIEAERVPAFRAAVASFVRQALGPAPYVPELTPDLEIDEASLTLPLVSEVQRLAPFGQANPEPLWVARNLPLREVRVVGTDHLKLVLGHSALDAIGFGLGKLATQLPARVDAAFRVAKNSYRGRDTLQLELEDLRAAQEQN